MKPSTLSRYIVPAVMVVVIASISAMGVLHREPPVEVVDPMVAAAEIVKSVLDQARDLSARFEFPVAVRFERGSANRLTMGLAIDDPEDDAAPPLLRKFLPAGCVIDLARSRGGATFSRGGVKFVHGALTEPAGALFCLRDIDDAIMGREITDPNCRVAAIFVRVEGGEIRVEKAKSK